MNRGLMNQESHHDYYLLVKVMKIIDHRTYCNINTIRSRDPLNNTFRLYPVSWITSKCFWIIGSMNLFNFITIINNRLSFDDIEFLSRTFLFNTNRLNFLFAEISKSFLSIKISLVKGIFFTH